VTFGEAYNSGRPFRRESWDEGRWIGPFKHYEVLPLLVEDWFGTDYEVKPVEPKWLKIWYSTRYEGGLIGKPTKTLGESDRILLIDSRPVKALVEAMKLAKGRFWDDRAIDATQIESELCAVEQLLKESP